MKTRLLVTGFVATALSTPVYALFPFINRGSNIHGGAQASARNARCPTAAPSTAVAQPRAALS